jgi:hypothetical protein
MHWTWATEVPGSSLVPSVMFEINVIFLSSSRLMSEQCPEVGHDRFLLRSLQFAARNRLAFPFHVKYRLRMLVRCYVIYEQMRETVWNFEVRYALFTRIA